MKAAAPLLPLPPLPGKVECLVGGGVKTVAGPGVINGCFATCKALITTACEPWYLGPSKLVC